MNVAFAVVDVKQYLLAEMVPVVLYQIDEPVDQVVRVFHYLHYSVVAVMIAVVERMKFAELKMLFVIEIALGVQLKNKCYFKTTKLMNIVQGGE